jgi:hypothetical protein
MKLRLLFISLLTVIPALAHAGQQPTPLECESYDDPGIKMAFAMRTDSLAWVTIWDENSRLQYPPLGEPLSTTASLESFDGTNVVYDLKLSRNGFEFGKIALKKAAINFDGTLTTSNGVKIGMHNCRTFELPVLESKTDKCVATAMSAARDYLKKHSSYNLVYMMPNRYPNANGNYWIPNPDYPGAIWYGFRALQINPASPGGSPQDHTDNILANLSPSDCRVLDVMNSHGDL